MELTQAFDRCLFQASVLRRAVEALRDLAPSTQSERFACSIWIGSEHWVLDHAEEFFALYGKGFTSARFEVAPTGPGGPSIRIEAEDSGSFRFGTRVSVSAKTRPEILLVMAVFVEAAPEARVPEPPPTPPTVFVGHGRSPQWRDLKDHLHEQHGYIVEAYETGARAGHTIRNVLQTMTQRAAFAALVMTGEDSTADAETRARQNVVHEVGLFQGALGFDRAVVLVEEGVEVFSNLQGIHQIRYSAGNIRETFGDVLATLRREFPSAGSPG